ncbi:inositol-pentakisphosphate 2-kinase [Xylogone sp. PMI_703]|nr:inositol-pentakisphosphate 2-kinase [Xylogone sp. PMI_703]
MIPEDAVLLPAGTKAQYLAEGAANIVFRIYLPPGTPGETVVETYDDVTPPPNKLLRLRKDIATTAPVQKSHDNWRKCLLPLFSPSEVVEQTLISVKSSNIVAEVNQDLRECESIDSGRECVRPVRRRGVFLADDDFGLLITDMTATSACSGTLEFKPKWLLQSPTAPQDSKRCRTCARIARLNALNAHKNLPPYSTFCPFDLLSKDPKTLDKVTRQLLPTSASPKQIFWVTRWLRTNTLLPKLRRLQAELDPKGVLEDPEDDKLRIAMTLRDCTVYLRFRPKGVKSENGCENDEDPEVDARLGDLDLKSSAKVSYWTKMERDLIEEGWYTGSENPKDKQPSTCALYRLQGSTTIQ